MWANLKDKCNRPPSVLGDCGNVLKVRHLRTMSVVSEEWNLEAYCRAKKRKFKHAVS